MSINYDVWYNKNQDARWNNENSEECETFSKFVKKLISIYILEENGCKIAMEDKVLNFVCGLLVVMKGFYHINIFPLIGETNIEDLENELSGSKDQT